MLQIIVTIEGKKVTYACHAVELDPTRGMMFRAKAPGIGEHHDLWIYWKEEGEAGGGWTVERAES